MPSTKRQWPSVRYGPAFIITPTMKTQQTLEWWKLLCAPFSIFGTPRSTPSHMMTTIWAFFFSFCSVKCSSEISEGWFSSRFTDVACFDEFTEMKTVQRLYPDEGWAYIWRSNYQIQDEKQNQTLRTVCSIALKVKCAIAGPLADFKNNKVLESVYTTVIKENTLRKLQMQLLNE